jgi:hypothetical protein
MIDVLSVLQVVLRDAGLSTSLISIDRMSLVSFEDDVLIGSGCVFENSRQLIENWNSIESSVLRRYSPHLRNAREKAWNVYSIFLCNGSVTPFEEREVHRIEEDLELTRKIAACGIVSRESLVRAILPILPLQYKPRLRPENVTHRLLTRIRTIAPRAADVVLDTNVPPDEAISLL